ncbi:helix-turn-helix domain-containing protein [Yoonia sp. GPGPB17]
MSAILDAGFRLFFKRGFARVSMDDIAVAAGVTKRTLYYHYTSKDALVGAVLDKQNEQSVAAFRNWTAPSTPKPEVFIAGLFAQLAEWSTQPGWTGSGFTRLGMELADLPGHPVRKASQRHKSALIFWLSDELSRRGISAPKRIAEQIVVAMEGAVALTVIHGDPEYFAIGSNLASKALSGELE